MSRVFALLLLSTMVLVNLDCTSRRQLRDDQSLRETLVLLRSAVAQFTLDHQRTPTSLADLVSGGYMKQLPTDPFTGRNDTWRVESSGEDFKVHSGSDAIGSAGTRYSSW